MILLLRLAEACGPRWATNISDSCLSQARVPTPHETFPRRSRRNAISSGFTASKSLQNFGHKVILVLVLIAICCYRPGLEIQALTHHARVDIAHPIAEAGDEIDEVATVAIELVVGLWALERVYRPPEAQLDKDDAQSVDVERGRDARYGFGIRPFCIYCILEAAILRQRRLLQRKSRRSVELVGLVVVREPGEVLEYVAGPGVGEAGEEESAHGGRIAVIKEADVVAPEALVHPANRD